MYKDTYIGLRLHDPALPGSRQYCKLFINFFLRLHEKSFIPARRDPSLVLPGSCFTGTKFSHVIILFHPIGMEKQFKACVWQEY